MDRIRVGIKSVVFMMILIFSITCISEIVENKAGRENYEDYFEDKSNIDVIFIGTSHMWNTIYPMDLWKTYGITSYNWGYSNCTPAESYYILQDIIKYHRPKLIVMDAYGISDYETKYREDRIEQQHVQFDEIPLSPNKLEGINDVFGNYQNRIDFVWNYFMYHNRWSELTKDDFCIESHSLKGALPLVGVTTQADVQFVDKKETKELECIQLPYYEKIMEFCKEENIEFLLICNPYVASENAQKRLNMAAKMAREKGYSSIYFKDMASKINYKYDIYDKGGHVNISGGKKVTEYLGEYITKNYELDDNRANIKWQKDYEEYFQYEIDRLNKETNVNKVLLQLYNKEFYSYINIDNSEEITEIEKELLDNITNKSINGILPENINKMISEMQDTENLSMTIVVQRIDNGEIIDCIGVNKGKIVRFNRSQSTNIEGK